MRKAYKLNVEESIAMASGNELTLVIDEYDVFESAEECRKHYKELLKKCKKLATKQTER